MASLLSGWYCFQFRVELQTCADIFSDVCRTVHRNTFL